MKRNLSYLTALTVFFAVIFVACTPEISTLPMSVSLDTFSLTLPPGESLKLSADVIPDEEAAIKWIWINNNHGSDACDRSIATNRGWIFMN